jgi:quinoprotein glucose dehydrogenase
VQSANFHGFAQRLCCTLRGMRRTIPILLWSAFPVLGAESDWSAYLGDKEATHFSRLRQITPENVQKLTPVWTYHSGGASPTNRTQIQCNPLVIGGVLYGTSPELVLFALDAATGRELWRFDPASVPGLSKGGVNRGLMYWQDPANPADARIYYANSNFLHAIDAGSGKPVPTFGRGGAIDLKQDVGREVGGLALTATSPGVIFGELLILGMRLGEGPAPAAPGPVRAFNVRTGALVWRFNTIPQPGEPGYDTWPADAHKTVGGANVWTGFALDEKRGIVFCPTGSAAFDFWGGNRIGRNEFANCLIALDARTGKHLWHQQLVHHDLWDRDLPAPPTLLTVRHEGVATEAVAQVTKSGHVFVFERETGKPLFGIDEIPVPASDLLGEAAWPTQPLPRKPAPFSRQVFSYNEITDVTLEGRRQVLERFSKLRPHVPFAPPSREGTVIFPGFDGGAEWGGAAADPEGVLYVNGNEMPWILTMVETKQPGESGLSSGAKIYMQICAACHGLDRMGNKAQNVPPLSGVEQRLKKQDIIALLKTGKGVMPAFGFLSEAQLGMLADHLLGAGGGGVGEAGKKEEETGADPFGKIPYTTTGYNRWLDAGGYPAVKPPWGTLNAIDLNTGEYRWSVPLGELPELTARGIPPTGAENYGGPVVTAGGLLFIAASKDENFRAFDSKSGRELWRFKLPAAGYATPATYAVGGRQFVVVACGGGKSGTKSRDSYMAFCLPD